MPTIDLLQQRTRELHLRNEIRKAGKLEFKSNFNLHVRFVPDGKHCVATVYQSFEDRDGEGKFSLSVTLEGIFSCSGVEGDEDKKEVHMMAYDALFPYLQMNISQLFAGTGLPGMTVKKMQLDPEKVTVASNRPPTLPIV